MSPKKQDHKRKKRETPQQKPAKKTAILDVLEKHTKETLKTAEKEMRENIYNFEASTPVLSNIACTL